MGSLFNLQQYNSTSYVDQLAIQLGLFQDRLTGESATAFLTRLYTAANGRRDHTMEGVVNDIADHIGLSVRAGVSVASPDPTTIITVQVGQLTIAAGTAKTVIPTVTIDPDDFWKWRKLSDVCADINTKTTSKAILLIDDTFAIQLVPQSSLGCSVGEDVATAGSQLKNTGILLGSELFNTAVPQYTLTSAGRLAFVSAPPPGTQISYIFNLSPLVLTCSEVSVISLKDPALATTAVSPDGAMVYQVREFVHDILAQDPSYWGN